jgi:hypothetical protein
VYHLIEIGYTIVKSVYDVEEVRKRIIYVQDAEKAAAEAKAKEIRAAMEEDLLPEDDEDRSPYQTYETWIRRYDVPALEERS